LTGGFSRYYFFRCNFPLSASEDKYRMCDVLTANTIISLIIVFLIDAKDLYS